MKKLVWIGLMMMSFGGTSASANCYIDCTTEVTSGAAQTTAAIETSYGLLKSQINKLKEQYQKQLNTLKAQNELLGQYKSLLKETTLSGKELGFLMQKFNSLKSNDIEVKAIENEK